MSKSLLEAIGLAAPQRSAPIATGGQAKRPAPVPVAEQHDRIARRISSVGDAKQRRELEGRLAKLRSVHDGGRTLGDRNKQAVLEKAELAAAAKLLADVEAIVGSAAAAPGAPAEASADMAVPPAPGPPAADLPAPPADAGASASKVASLPDLLAECDKHLRAHRFRATPRPELVPGDTQCDFWLDDRSVKQEDVRAALLAALPALESYPIQLARHVAEHSDVELRQALLMGGRMPRQASTVVAMPEGVLKRSIDGQPFWQPAPRATMGGMEPLVVDAGWLNDFFEFYDVAPAAAGGKPGSCRFNGAEDTIAGATRKAGEQATLAGYKPNPGAATSIAKTLLEKREAARRQGATLAAEALKKDGQGPPSEAPNQGLQVVPSAGVAYTGHWTLKPVPNQKSPKSDTVVQFQFALNDVQHPKDRTGKELQGQLVVGYNAATNDWQVLAGGQFAAVVAIWGRVQVQCFANVQAGVTKKLSDSSPASGVFQAMAGAQVAITTFLDIQVTLQIGPRGNRFERPGDVRLQPDHRRHPAGVRHRAGTEEGSEGQTRRSTPRRLTSCRCPISSTRWRRSATPGS